MAIDHEKMRARYIKALLAENPVARRHELASFILSAAGAAQDLLKLTTHVNQGMPLSPEVEDAMDYLERAINDVCVSRLGCRLTEQTPGTEHTADSSLSSAYPCQ